eukprot:TRINITY_DN5011_c0_g1_i4.p3 TRINITY_DN5011_c0_g1~~TRINITY_DN5011_c0_g1_i4.p3  ORF type:complete len:154 (-),score=30.06 TRINITY_DN5011_c0_g1_i4:554-1015(-)
MSQKRDSEGKVKPKQVEKDEEEWWHSESSDEEKDKREEEELMQPHTIEQDDALLYDPQLDDEDEKWNEQQRHGHISDAVLSCPFCFTTLCLDCQKHAQVPNQYRAMFVMNCVDKARKDGQDYSEVCCEVCGLVVGAKDNDEVYHFFEVIASSA